MSRFRQAFFGFFSLLALLSTAFTASANQIELGPRPYYLISTMNEGPLKNALSACQNSPMTSSKFSLGHRGAPMQFPEHTQAAYEAGARMGAGILECDVTFTKDKQLVCRHSQCDLHTTTNILTTPLAQKCSQTFTPFNVATQTPASARCCTSDITLEEFKTLKGKMDSFNPQATSPEAYQQGTPSWRTDLYAHQGQLMTHAQSIALFKSLGVDMTPELKTPSVAMPFNGLTQTQYAQAIIDDYKSQHVPAKQVWLQSFHLPDHLYWQKHEPEFAKQAIYLDDRDEPQSSALENQLSPREMVDHPERLKPTMAELKAMGINIIAPPIWALIRNTEGKLVPSNYAKAAKKAGLNIIAWSFERSAPLNTGGGWYYQSVNGMLGGKNLITRDGDIYEVLDVLAQQVGVIGVFSDWAATTTYYANCRLAKNRNKNG
ncbi:glycerophosphodiester phosphodiesterase family protein [Pseudoalteromonas xiamenensis]